MYISLSTYPRKVHFSNERRRDMFFYSLKAGTHFQIQILRVYLRIFCEKTKHGAIIIYSFKILQFFFILRSQVALP